MHRLFWCIAVLSLDFWILPLDINQWGFVGIKSNTIFSRLDFHLHQSHLLLDSATTLVGINSQDSDSRDTVSPGGVVEFVCCPLFCQIKPTYFSRMYQILTIRYPMFSKHILCTAFFQTQIRIGEASNPGPSSNSGQGFRFALVNPTTVLHREAAIDKLQVHCLALAETSATKLTQQQVTNAMKQRGYTTSWGAPVDNHKATLSSHESLRGQAAGVAFMAKVPLKPFRNENPPTALQGTRVHFAYVQYGATTILKCVIYGLANGNEKARETTNDLITYVAEIILAHHGPAIVCGDFNHDLHQLPAVNLLQQAGFVNLLEIHQTLYGKTMPPTYKEQSTRDLMLFSTELAGHVASIEVLKHVEFPGHKPVVVTLDLPDGGLTKRMWKSPKNWQELRPDKQIIEQCYSKMPELELTQDSMCNLQLWSKKVEQAVDTALAQQHQQQPDMFPASGLPFEYQGRFQYHQLSTKHFRCFAPKARQGDFEPSLEVKTIRATQLVRQLRRLQSLRRRMHRLLTYPDIWDRTWKGLEEEWKAVLKASGFQGTFTRWVCHELSWPFLPQNLPSLSVVEALEEAVQSLVTEKLRLDAEQHKKKVFVQHQIDHLFNYDRQSYAKLREPPAQFIQALRTDSKFACQIQWIADGNVYCQIHGQIPLRGNLDFKWQNNKLHATCDSDNILTIAEENWPSNLNKAIGDSFSVTATYLGMQPTDIHNALEQYWAPIWQRDEPKQSIDEQEWDNFRQLLEQENLPKLVESFDHTSLTLWKQILHEANFHSAPGSDGWHYQELAELPDNALKDLVCILTSENFNGFSKKYMTARVVSLPKQESVEEARHTRPITILPTLYRVWSAVVTKVMLAQADEKLDEALIGFVQNRSGHRGMYDLSWKIEWSHHQKQRLAGLTLDLTKAFNQFPRIPVKMILLQLGLPENLAVCWLNSLNNLQRYFDHRGWASEPVGSSTGVPEGDGMSILCMLAIAQLWVNLIQHPGLTPMAYADNLSWSSDSFAVHEQTLSITIEFFRMLKIPIDWNKTWVWSTHAEDHDQWKHISEILLPNGCELQMRHEAMDLGISMNYAATNKLNDFQQRFQQVAKRLEKLFRENYSLPLTAKLIQTAVWTKLFYGREVGLIGRHHFQTLRVLAARALTHRFQPGIAALAVTLASNQLDDPEIFVLLNAIREAQHFLGRADPLMREQFCFVASRGTGVPGKTKGPAGALKGYLMRIGATIDSTGKIIFHSGLQLDVLNTPFGAFKQIIRQEWMQDLLVLNSERQAFKGAPTIDRRLTLQTLNSFPSHQQKQLLCEMVHAFQTQKQKSKWTGADAPECPYCPQIDTRKHRLTSCDALQHVYCQHVQIVDGLNELDEIHCELPVIYASPFRDLILQCHYQSVPVMLVPEVVDFVNTLLKQGVTPIFFSDGSCFESKTPGYSLAAWSLIVCKAHTEADCDMIGRLSDNLGLAFSSFMTLATCRSHGDQTIDRAELAAMVTLFQQWRQCRLVTDSSYVMAANELVHGVSNPKDLIGRPNADLLVRLWHCKSEQHQLTKVKSHTLESNNRALNQAAFLTVGNALADITAKQANQQLSGDLVQMWKQEVAQIQAQQQMRKRQYQLLLDLQPERTKLERNDKHLNDQDERNPPINTLGKFWPDRLKEWSPISFFTLQLHWPMNISFDNQWGEQTTSECLQWLNSLKWPTDSSGAINESGITYAELFLDFLRDRKFSVPTRVPGHGTTMVMENSLFRFKTAGYGFYHAIKSFFYLIKWIDRALGGEIFRMLPRGHVGSLQRQGCTNKHHGIRLRPILNDATAVVDAIQGFRDRATDRYTGLTKWPWGDDFFYFFAGLWELD